MAFCHLETIIGNLDCFKNKMSQEIMEPNSAVRGQFRPWTFARYNTKIFSMGNKNDKGIMNLENPIHLSKLTFGNKKKFFSKGEIMILTS